MGLGSIISPIFEAVGGSAGEDIADPGGLFEGITGETGAEAAKKAQDITNQELIRQFELSQKNLRPFLESAQRQLPGLEQQISTGGFTSTIDQLRPELSQFLAPVQGRSTQAAQEQLQLAGLGDRGTAAQTAGEIDPRLFNQLLLGAEADLFGNRLAISGIGKGAGSVLSELGQRTGSSISESNIQAQLAAEQAKATGTQNALGIAGLAASFMSDERLKEEIEEIGDYKGLRVIRWKWRDFVPESWKDVNFGFSAQDVLNKYPQFVIQKSGFLSIDRDGLINHLDGVNYG